MSVQRIYHPEVPEFLRAFSDTPEMRRLEGVGMNCGCEYTAFPRFARLAPYTRFRHSLSAGLIVWHFTGDMAQSVAALFHDIATPAFAHAVDFMRGDYIAQEATEAGTEAIIRRSAAIGRLLEAHGLAVEDVRDYHRYPIADNDTPRLSADRLEYTLGNLENYGFRTVPELRRYYEALAVSTAEDGAPELAFSDMDAALGFAMDALECSRIYVAGEDRWAMQALAELLARAVEKGAMAEADLYRTEAEVIRLLEADPELRAGWARFRGYRELLPADAVPAAERRIVPAKRRYIDPLVTGAGRLSDLSPDFRAARDAFLALPLDGWIAAR